MNKLANKLFFLILLLTITCFFKPFYFTYANISIVNMIYLTAIRAAFVIIFTIYIVQSKFSKYTIALFTFYMIKFLITFVNNAAIGSVITEAYPILGICMLIEICLRKRPEKLIQAFCYVLNFLTIVSFITILIKPEGYGTIYDKIYFLYGGNQITAFFILNTVLNCINTYIKKRKYISFLGVILIGMNTYSVFVVKSASGIIAWTVLILYIFIPYVKKLKAFKQVFNFKTYMIVYAIFFISVVFFKVQDNFSEFFQKYLGKDVTFTNRTYLWEIAISQIKLKPIIGYGMGESSNIIAFGSGYLSSHNQFVQILYEGGALSLVCFLIIAYIGGVKLVKHKKNEIAGILSIGFLSTCLVLFSEAIGFFHIFIFLVFAYNVDKIIMSNNLETR